MALDSDTGRAVSRHFSGMSSRGGFRGSLSLGFLLLSFLAAYFPVCRDLLHFWTTSEDYAHGLFIIPICTYLIYRKRETLLNIEPVPASWGLLIFILGLLTYVIASFAGIATLASMSMIPTLGGAVIYLYGFRTMRELSFVFFMFLFAIPIPAQILSAITIPLQLLVSKVSTFMAMLLGVPVYRQGNLIHIPGQILHVVTACSGLRSLIALLALGALMAHLCLRAHHLRSILFLSAFPTAILVNVLRVVTVIVGQYYFHLQLSQGVLHGLLGMMVFLSALAVTFSVERVLSKWDRPTTAR